MTMTEWEVTARAVQSPAKVTWMVGVQSTPLDALRQALTDAGATSVEQPVKPLLLTQRELDLLFQMCGRALQAPDYDDDLVSFLPSRPLDRATGASLQQRIADLLDT